jgi:hypothetical protein
VSSREYDPSAKAFWLAGRHLFKVPADKVKDPVGPGDVVGAKDVTGWCATRSWPASWGRLRWRERRCPRD